MTTHTCLVAIAASLAAASSSLSGTVGPNNADPPPTVSLTGVVRDFRERTVAGGHPDFERRPAEGFGQYCKNVEEELGANGKPEYNSCGFKLNRLGLSEGQDYDIHIFYAERHRPVANLKLTLPLPTPDAPPPPTISAGFD